MSIPTELADYVAKQDRSFAWSNKREQGDFTEYTLTSQTWRGIPWRHSLTVVRSARAAQSQFGVLIITGDRREADLQDAQRICHASGVPVATLFDVPNQPLWNLREDALIAHTFQQYLQSGEGDWPLLFPMVKSAVRAMDVLRREEGLERFLVTGMSKRGWTTWLLASLGDSRIAGTAPMIFDFLNMPAQLQHMVDQWGRYSEMIGDYTERDLQETVDTPEGRRLATIVDPFSYREQIAAPTLMIRGSNDPYWTVDAASLYWSALSQPRWSLTLPNTGHASGDGALYTQTLGAFARSLSGEFTMPDTRWTLDRQEGYIVGKLVSQIHEPRSLILWMAQSHTGDFREAQWRDVSKDNVGHKFQVIHRLPQAEKIGAYMEARYEISGNTFSVCSQTSRFG